MIRSRISYCRIIIAIVSITFVNLSVKINGNEAFAQQNEAPVPPWLKDVIIPVLAVGISAAISIVTYLKTTRHEERKRNEMENRLIKEQILLKVKFFRRLIAEVDWMLKNPTLRSMSIPESPYEVHETLLKIDDSIGEMTAEADQEIVGSYRFRHQWSEYENSWMIRAKRQEFVNNVFNFRNKLIERYNPLVDKYNSIASNLEERQKPTRALKEDSFKVQD